ncbi:HNH endonuclease [Spiroplasma endosymbiont of Cantharis rufa]|uniref:HNH endonuclease n=1 Tax=Spiroplasma endosymbiont of Cantharis rufa TaxID=3066279 RepID=UPI0030D0236C
MAKKDLPTIAKHAWENAPKCNCGAQQDTSDRGHKKCFRCKEQIEYGAYQGWQPNNSNCWNVEHLNPKAQGGTNQKENLKAVHKKCNK